METPPEGAPEESTEAPAAVPLPPPELLRDALADDQDEVLRLVDQGASSPEDLRVIAERMRERREREDAIWAAQVKPGLIQARKGRLRLSDLRRETAMEHDDRSQRSFLLAVAGAALVALVVLSALKLSIVVLAIPVIAFLGYAFWLGLHPPAEDAAAAPAPDDDAPAA
jgi:hypothetical protein